MVFPVRHARFTGLDDSLHLLSALVAVSRFLVTATPVTYWNKPRWRILYSLGPVKDGELYGVLKCSTVRACNSTRAILKVLQDRHGFVEQTAIAQQRRSERGEVASGTTIELVALSEDAILSSDEGEKRLEELLEELSDVTSGRRPINRRFVRFVWGLILPTHAPTDPSLLNDAEKEELVTLFMKWARRYYEESYMHKKDHLQGIFDELLYLGSATLDIADLPQASRNVFLEGSLSLLLYKLTRWDVRNEAKQVEAAALLPVPSSDAQSSSADHIREWIGEPMALRRHGVIAYSTHHAEADLTSSAECPLDLSLRRQDKGT